MNEWTREQWESAKNNSTLSLFYIYTPMCGTCQVASKMMNVIKEMVSYPIGQANINFLGDLAIEQEIEISSNFPANSFLKAFLVSLLPNMEKSKRRSMLFNPFLIYWKL